MQNTKVNMECTCMTCKEIVLVFYYKEYKKVFELISHLYSYDTFMASGAAVAQC